jgi:acyl-CoA dehydrogenase
MGELGLLGVAYDEKYGGAGADFLTGAVLHESARARAAARSRWRSGSTMTWLTAIAVTEPGGGSDVAAIRTRALREGDHYVLKGSKMFITNGAMADLYFVAARVEGA